MHVAKGFKPIGLVSLFAGLLLAPLHLQAQDPLQIGSEKQLFVGPWAQDGRDEYLVESMRGIEMTMNEAHITGEKLMDIDKPWEMGSNEMSMLDMRQYVIKDGNLFRMYYGALPGFPDLWNKPYCRILCYAESRDGIHWTKPNLGVCEWNGSRDNNIILPNDDFPFVFSEADSASVFIDPVAKNPDEKYKMFTKMVPVHDKDTKLDDTQDEKLQRGQYALCSPDGIHWKPISLKKMNPGSADTQFSVFWDDRCAQYVQYTRMKMKNPSQQNYYVEKYGQKVTNRTVNLWVGRTTSDDFVNWSKESAVFGPDNIDDAGMPDGVNRLDFYGGNISKYSEAKDIYIGLPNAYGHWKFDMSRTHPSSGKTGIQLPSTLDVQLITSRDGIHWNRAPKRKPFIRLGPEGSFWSKTIWPGAEVIRVADELWIFFGALDVTHKEQNLLPSSGGRGLAKLRLDGFISADAAYTGGELITRPLVFRGSRLQLNVETGAGGFCKVEILQPDGKSFEEFAPGEMEEITGNYPRVNATWNGKQDVSELAGRPVKLRFLLRDAKLYSFQFKNE